MEIIRCPRCAKEIPQASQFCRRCGCVIARYVGAAPVAFSGRTPPRERAATLGQPKVKPKPVARTSGGGVGVLAVVGVLSMISFFRVAHQRQMYTPPPIPSINAARSYPLPSVVYPPQSYPIPLRSDGSPYTRAPRTPPTPQLPQLPPLPAPPQPYQPYYPSSRYDRANQSSSAQQGTATDEQGNRR